MSLLELVLGMLLLLVAIGGAYGMSTQASRQRRVDDEQRQAFVTCRSQMDALRALAPAALPAQNGRRFPVDLDGDGINDLQAVAGTPGGLTGQIRIQTVSSSGGESLYRATLTVTWLGVSGLRTFSMQSLLSNRFAQ